jgi:hypothetical protein
VTPQIVTVDLRQLASVKPRRPGTTARSVRAAEGRYTIHAADGGFAVHDSKGLLVGPLAFSSLWRDAEPCRITVDVAPTVRYDRAAGRWLLARWAPPVSAAAFYLCVALSATSNPVTGGWYVYGFPLPMYRADSEVDVKPDGYRLGISIGGAQILFLLDRTRMLGGAPAGYAQISPSERRPTP